MCAWFVLYQEGYGIPLDESQKDQVSKLKFEALETLRERIKQEKRWPL